MLIQKKNKKSKRLYTLVCMKKVKEDKSKYVLVSRNCKNIQKQQK